MEFLDDMGVSNYFKSKSNKMPQPLIVIFSLTKLNISLLCLFVCFTARGRRHADGEFQQFDICSYPSVVTLYSNTNLS